MANLKHAVPASLRKQVQGSKFAQRLMARTRQSEDEPTLVKSLFARLPEEPEDAKMTGVTRSLARRLLGLNVAKVRISKALVTVPGVKAAC